MCVISNFSREEDNNCAPLGYYAASSGNIIVIILPPLCIKAQNYYSPRNSPKDRSSDGASCLNTCLVVKYIRVHYCKTTQLYIQPDISSFLRKLVAKRQQNSLPKWMPYTYFSPSRDQYTSTGTHSASNLTDKSRHFTEFNVKGA